MLGTTALFINPILPEITSTHTSSGTLALPYGYRRLDITAVGGSGTDGTAGTSGTGGGSGNAGSVGAAGNAGSGGSGGTGGGAGTSGPGAAGNSTSSGNLKEGGYQSNFPE